MPEIVCNVYKKIMKIVYKSFLRGSTWPRCPWLFQTRKFRRLGFSPSVVAKWYILQQLCLNEPSICNWIITTTRPTALNGSFSQAKVTEEVNRKCCLRNTMLQVLTPYTDPERHKHRVTDRRTDGSMMPIADHTVWHYDRLKTKWRKRRRRRR